MSATVIERPSRAGTAKHSDVVTSVAFSPDGLGLVSGGWDGLVKLWDLSEGPAAPRLVRVMRGEWDEVESVAFAPDGRSIVGLGVGWDGAPYSAVTIWEEDAERGRELLRTPGKVDSMAFSPDGRTLATAGGESRAVTLWSVADGSELLSLPEHSAPVWSVAFAPDGRLAAASGVVPAMVEPGAEERRGEIKIWDVSGPKPVCLRRLVGHDHGVAAATFAPDGATLASGGFDRAVKLWNLDDGACRLDLTGHIGWVAALAFSPVEPLLASGSHDRAIRLWDLRDGTLRSVLQGHAGNVYSVAFAPDGRTLASGSLDGAVRLWNVPDAD